MKKSRFYILAMAVVVSGMLLFEKDQEAINYNASPIGKTRSKNIIKHYSNTGHNNTFIGYKNGNACYRQGSACYKIDISNKQAKDNK